ncbi:TlyA family RNA methyltransferase [Microbacterium halophytorum]|uniref:TlyA family RNA methyltransferase n=1 Tax=Microbacterium halophytorum TaxID=2067568 RepID=UPI000CFCA4F4|nr:TlyA family RNA methyltransferase [Microbacterium halophytorum]
MSARLDAELAARGLARSRTQAAVLIAAGAVTVAGAVATKPSLRVDRDADIRVTGGDQYVSRAAHKLIAALDGFGVDAAGRTALDMGASTGGFTQVLLERGASPVIAVDVGHDQLAPSLRADERVRSVEGYNVRHMTAESLAESSGVDSAPSVVTGDLSFISLRYVLPAVAAVIGRSPADVLLLVKPQFEVGRTGVRGGIVVDPELRRRAVHDVIGRAREAGFAVRGVLPSPVEGTHGNREALMHLTPGPDDGRDWDHEVGLAVAG